MADDPTAAPAPAPASEDHEDQEGQEDQLAARTAAILAGEQPIRVSHSALEDWGKCPRKWAWGSVGRRKQAPAPPAIAGNAVHTAIEEEIREFLAIFIGGPKWTRKPLGHGNWADMKLASDWAELPRPVMPLDVLEAHALAYLSQAWVTDDPEGLVGQEERWHLWRRVRGALAAYHAEIAPRMWPVDVERQFVLPPTGLSVERAPWVFKGYIDVIVERPKEGPALREALRPDGTIQWRRFNTAHESAEEADERGVLWAAGDWKISRRFKPGEEHARAQATGYLLALHLMRVRAGRPELGGIDVQDMLPVRRLSFVVLPERQGYTDLAGVGQSDPAVPAEVQWLGTQRTKEQRAAYAGMLATTAAQMRAALEQHPDGEIPAKPNWSCPWCGFLSRCQEGQAAVRASGKPAMVPGMRPSDLRGRAQQTAPDTYDPQPVKK